MNAFQDRVGLTIEEGVVNALNLGSGASTRNIGLLVERERGVAGKAILVTNPKQDRKVFGLPKPTMYSPYVAQMLFDNAGGYGVNLYQIRLVGAGSVAAFANIANAAHADQGFVTTVITNAGAAAKQTNRVVASNVEVGDTFAIAFTTPAGINLSHVAATTEAYDVYVALAAAINADATLQGANIEAEAFANYLEIRKTIVNSTFVQTSSTTNNAAAAQNILKVIAGRMGEEDKGDWGNNLKVKVYPVGHKSGSKDGYLLEVFYKGVFTGESYISAGADWQSLIDAVNARSEYIKLEPIDTSIALNIGVQEVALGGGVYNAPADMDWEPTYDEVTGAAKGLALFGGIDVQIVAVPEVFDVAFHKKAEAFAETVGKFYVFNMPYLATENVLDQYYNTLFSPDQSFLGGYLNWAEVTDEVTKRKVWVPAIGYVLGAGYIRKAGMNNGAVWTPPAGTETFAKGVHRFTHDDLDEVTISRYAKKYRCNVIKYVENVGFCVWTSRTYSNNSLFESIHVRLLTNWLVKQLPLRNVSFLQKIITPSFIKSTKIDNVAWFKDLYEKGGIEQSVPFEEAVIVEVEQLAENRKEAEMDIAWIPPECLEHMHIRLSRNDGALVARVVA